MLPFNHFLFAILIFRKLKLKENFLILLALISLIPDIDFLLNIEHRTLTHSIFIPLFFLFFCIFNKFFGLIAISLISHIALDIVTGKVALFYPLEIWIGENIFGNLRFQFEIAILVILIIILKNELWKLTNYIYLEFREKLLKRFREK